MNVPPIARAHADDLRLPTVWWSVALAAITVLVAAGFATVEGQTDLDASLEELPDAVRALVGGVDGLSFTSPAGYLHGQLFANLLPMLLTVFAIGLGSRAIGGAESDGHLQLIATYPVARARIAIERAAVALAAVSTVAGAGLLSLLVAAPLTGLREDGPAVAAVIAATIGAWALAVLHGAIAFAAGAISGSRATALTSAASIAVGGFVLQSVAASTEALAVVGLASPWQWFADSTPLTAGATAIVAPVSVCLASAVVAAATGIRRLDRRDLR